MILVLTSVGCNSGKIEQLEKENQDLRAELRKQQEIMSNFNYQERCAEQARKTFNELGYAKKPFASYENHYNGKLNKCFMEISNTESVAGGNVVTSRNISDALEGKTYGEYVWQTEKGKKFWEIPPLMCTVTSASGEERQCKTDDEFKELIKPYMDIS